MKKIFAVAWVLCIIFTFSGCRKNNLSEADVMSVINENGLNILNSVNCGYQGEELELKIKAVTIEKSNVFEDDASCDAEVELSSDKVNAKVFYRFDLTKEKGGWKLKTVKNHKRFILTPVKGIDSGAILKDIREMYPASYKFSVDSNVFDEENNTCEIVVSYTKENETSKSSGFISVTYKFDEKALQWVMDDFDEAIKSVDEWKPYGKWYFSDGKYFYCTEIAHMADNGETAEIKITASIHESVVYTADFQESFTVLVTPDNNSLYFEPFEVEIGEERVSLMLCLREDSLYFSTDNTNEYTKANLPRVSKGY